MHAASVFLTIDAALAPAAAAAFTSDILPRVRGAPGFVAGYWVDPVDGQGFSLLLFETEEQAFAATPPATAWSAPGVTILRIDVRRVAVAIPLWRDSIARHFAAKYDGGPSGDAWPLTRRPPDTRRYRTSGDVVGNSKFRLLWGSALRRGGLSGRLLRG
jgi:hypothetical protein